MQNQKGSITESANALLDETVEQKNQNANHKTNNHLDLGCQTRLEGIKMVRRIAAALAEAGIDVKLKAAGTKQMAKLTLIVPPEEYEKAQKIINKTVPHQDFYNSLFG